MWEVILARTIGIILVLIMCACLRSIIKFEIDSRKENMENKEKFIQDIADKFVEKFRFYCTEEERSRWSPHPALDVTEMTDDNIRDAVKEFFEKNNLTEADRFMYHAIDPYVEDTYDKIDWQNGMSHDDREKYDPMYIQWDRHNDVSSVWSDVCRLLKMSEKWVEIHGKRHTDEEAAKIAADKWCELCFGWHLQDNGALNETHGGGFPACALGTILANNAKEGITEDVKVKAHELFYGYYLNLIQYERDRDRKHIKWLVENLKNEPDDERPWDWERYGFMRDELYCDYGPDTGLYLILYNAGVPRRDVSSICPWKTGISIRFEDNAVFYNTYQHRDEIGV